MGFLDSVNLLTSIRSRKISFGMENGSHFLSSGMILIDFEPVRANRQFNSTPTSVNLEFYSSMQNPKPDRYLEDEASLEKTIEGGLGGYYGGVQINSSSSQVEFKPPYTFTPQGCVVKKCLKIIRHNFWRKNCDFYTSFQNVLN